VVTGTRTHEVDSDGVRLVVTDAGPAGAPAVLLLHGFPDSRRMWRYQVDDLVAAGYRVLAPDLRGFGDSDAPAEEAAYRVPVLLTDLVAVLDALDVGRAAVVGHDWGAVLAWAFASAHPERTAALVAVSVGHPRARRDGGPAQVLRGAYIGVFLVPGLAERLLPLSGWWALRRWGWGGARPGEEPDLARQVEDLSRPGRLTAALAWYRANLRPGRRRTRPAPGAAPRSSRTVACPTLGVWSTRDPALVERQMTGSRRFVSGPWRYEKVVGIDHWVPVHAPRTLDRLLLDFLRSVPWLP
jgi:pimeloyl-ACP methyl ester carboxylesterase